MAAALHGRGGAQFRRRCKNRQRQSGTAFATIVGVPKKAQEVSGTLKTYEDVSDTGKGMHRRFCAECGSSIAIDADGYPDLTFVEAGTLDDTSWVVLTVQFFCASAQPWVSLPEKIQPFQRMSGQGSSLADAKTGRRGAC